MPDAVTVSYAEILAQVLVPSEPACRAEAARALLKLRFNDDARKRIERLLAKNSRTTISVDERLELERYLQIGQILDLMHTMARLSLKHIDMAS